jgi:hypothetical protein
MLELLHTKSAKGYPVYMEPSTKNCILMKVSDPIPHGYEVKNLSCTIFQFLVIKTLDPELDPCPQLEKCWIRIRIKSMRI